MLLAFRNVKSWEETVNTLHFIYSVIFKNRIFVELLLLNLEVAVELIRTLGMFWVSLVLGHAAGSSSRNFWVSGLASTTRATDLKNLFSKYGKVRGGVGVFGGCLEFFFYLKLS